MLMRKLLMVSLVCLLLLGGCEKADKFEDLAEETMENETENKAGKVSYEAYTGVWTVDGKTYDQILSEGGVELSCTIIENNQFTGSLFFQQEITGRFGMVDEIRGEIVQNELYFDYSDDEWGNSGVLHIQFQNDRIQIELLNVKEPVGGSDYGINGTYELRKENETENSAIASSSGLTGTDDETRNAADERSQYYQASAYYSEIVDYWENVREVRDISNVMQPLFETNKRFYKKKDFENEPALVIHLAKNEIYARHGYIFKDENLQNYFMGCIWYSPICEGKDFDDSVFNEFEKVNLEILAEIDSY